MPVSAVINNSKGGQYLETNLEIMRRFLETMQAGNPEETCHRFLSEDFELHEPPGLPQAGVFRGQEAPIRVGALYRGIWDVTVEHMELWEAAADDVVFSRYTMTWTAKKTGKSMTQPVVEINRFRDGRLCRMDVYHFDPIGLCATLVDQ